MRKTFTGSTAKRFSDITKNVGLQSKLQTAYGHVNKVEAWIGLMSEDHIPGGSMGPTLYAIWVSEFRRLRDGDRFFYSKKNLFSKTMYQKFRRLRQILSGKQTMKMIILRNTNIKTKEIGKSTWRSHH